MDNGAPVFHGTANLQPILVDGQLQFRCGDSGPMNVAKKGVCVLYDGTFRSEILADDSEDSFVVMSMSEQFYPALSGYQFYSANETLGGNSKLDVTGMTGSTVGSICVLYDDYYMEWKSYEILDIKETYIVVDDGGYLYSIGSWGYAYPDSISHTLTIGGAYNDFQSLLDDQSAYDYDQWVFIGSDLAPSASLIFTSSTDGSSDNNTRLNIVGYIDHAYDCLPSGHGYFPEALGDGPYYRDSLSHAKIGNDVAAQSATMRKVTLSVPDWASVFRFNDLSENVNFMGLCFYGTVTNRFPIQMNTGSYGSIHVRHCVSLMDNTAEAAYGLIRLHYSGSGGTVHDCYVYNSKIIDENTGLDEAVSHFDIGHCCLERCSSFIHQSYNSVTVHHCIMKMGHTPISIIGYGHMIAHNNVFYCQEAPTQHWSMADLTAHADSYKGLVRILDGGELRYWDYNLIYDLAGNPWPDDKKVYLTEGYNANWKGEHVATFGIHDVLDKNPLFVDPANWDFRLRPGSPCLAAGRPDTQGSPTDIGLAYERPCPNSLYGNNIPLYSN